MEERVKVMHLKCTHLKCKPYAQKVSTIALTLLYVANEVPEQSTHTHTLAHTYTDIRGVSKYFVDFCYKTRQCSRNSIKFA